MALPIIHLNSSYTRYITPNWSDYPNGLILDYDTCPDDFNNNSMPKLIKVCCEEIIFKAIGDSYYGRIDHFLRYYGVSVLVGPAIFFNLLALIVLNSFSHLHNGKSTRFYMQALCVFDALCIISKFINEHVYVRNVGRAQPFPLNAIFFKSILFTESIFTTTSVYILIVMSFDKLICVLLPLKVGSILTVNKARLTCAIIVGISVVFSSYHLFINDVKISRGIDASCTIVNNNTPYKNRSNSINFEYDLWQDPFWKKPLKQLRNIVTIFIPIILLFLCNISISITLAKAQKNSKNLMGDAGSEHCTSFVEPLRVNGQSAKKEQKIIDNYVSSHKASITIENESTNKNKNNILKPSKRMSKDSEIIYLRSHRASRPSNEIILHSTTAEKNSHYISFMLFAVCFGFVILNLPYAIHNIFESKLAEVYGHTGKITKTKYVELVKYDLYDLICQFLIDLSHVVNFFLYYLSGSKFRSHLYAFLSCKKLKRKHKNNFLPSNRKGLSGRIRKLFHGNSGNNSFIDETYTPRRKSTTVTAKIYEWL